jgi:hypothetical protein
MNKGPAAAATAALLFLAAASGAAPLITGAEARAFLGGRTGKIIYQKTTDMQVYFLDFNDSVLVEHRVSNHPVGNDTYWQSPMIHPDGTRFIYEWGSGIYMRNLVQGSSTSTLIYQRAPQAGYSLEPHWWIDPKDSANYILFVAGNIDDHTWPPSSGGTYAIKLDKAFKPVGSPTMVIPFMMSAGRTKSGTWGGTSNHSTGMYKMNPARVDSAFAASKNWLPDGQSFLACNASMSTSKDPLKENRMMHLTSGGTSMGGKYYDNHKAVIVRSWDDADPDHPFWWMGLPGDRCNNDGSGNLFWGAPEWSTDEDYFTATGSKEIDVINGDLYMVHINFAGESRLLRVLSGDGANLQSHLWVKDGVRPARMILDKQSLAFAAYKKDTANPPPDTVTITNAGDGKLPVLKLEPLPKWLQVSIVGNGADSVVKLVTSVLRDSVAPGVYRDTVRVSFGAGVDSAAYAVVFRYSDPVLTTLMPRPAHAVVRAGDSLKLEVLPLDQGGKPMPGETPVAWDGPDALKPSADGWFRADTALWKTYSAVASSGAVKCTTQVTVVRTLLRVDAGAWGPAQAFPGWAGDSAFASGGVSATRSDGLEPTLYPDAAPSKVYLNWRVGFSGYHFDSLPNGRYRARLHLVAPPGGVASGLTLKMEGVKVLDNFWVLGAPDSGRFAADVREVAVTVSDGNGLSVEASGTRAAALAGLELWDEGLPLVSVQSPNGGETFRVGDTLSVRWTADPLITSVGIELSVDSGAHWLPLTRTRSVAPGDADWANFKWVIPDSLDSVSLASNKAKVLVYDYFGADRDRSDSVFTIVALPGGVRAAAGAPKAMVAAPLPGGRLQVTLGGARGPISASLSDLRGRNARAWSWGAGDKVLEVGGLAPGLYRLTISGSGWARSLLVPWMP